MLNSVFFNFASLDVVCEELNDCALDLVNCGDDG